METLRVLLLALTLALCALQPTAAQMTCQFRVQFWSGVGCSGYKGIDQTRTLLTDGTDNGCLPGATQDGTAPPKYMQNWRAQGNVTGGNAHFTNYRDAGCGSQTDIPLNFYPTAYDTCTSGDNTNNLGNLPTMMVSLIPGSCVNPCSAGVGRDCIGCVPATATTYTCTSCNNSATGPQCLYGYQHMCQNSTTCTGQGCTETGNGTYTCSCDAAHSGPNCASAGCNPAPSSLINTTSCACTTPYYSTVYGSNSQLGVVNSNCDSTCTNGYAFLNSTSGRYGCVNSCQAPITGNKCYGGWVNPCLNNATICSTYGTCSNPLNNTYSCACDGAHEGLNCQLQKCNSSDPNMNQANCQCNKGYGSAVYGQNSQRGVVNATCELSCGTGFVLLNTTSNRYQCVARSQAPCGNQNQCSFLGNCTAPNLNTFVCSCLPGYRGAHCEFKDPCYWSNCTSGCSVSADNYHFNCTGFAGGALPLMALNSSVTGVNQRYPWGWNLRSTAAANNTRDPTYTFQYIQRPGLVNVYGEITPGDFSYEWYSSPYGYTNSYPPWFINQGVKATNGLSISGNYTISMWYKYNRELECPSQFNAPCDAAYAASGGTITNCPAVFTTSISSTSCKFSNGNSGYVTQALVGSGTFATDATGWYNLGLDLGIDMYQTELSVAGGTAWAAQPVPKLKLSGFRMDAVVLQPGMLYNFITKFNATNNMTCLYAYEYTQDGYLTSRDGFTQPYKQCNNTVAVPPAPLGDISIHYSDPSHNSMSDLVVYSQALSPAQIDSLYPRYYNVCNTLPNCQGCQPYGVNSYTCSSCTNGFTPCPALQCSPDSPLVNTTTCTCPSGLASLYTGYAPQFGIDGADCSLNCTNGSVALLNSTLGLYQCVAPAQNPCYRQTCNLQGTCVPTTTTTFQCQCLPQYQGTFCELINPCGYVDNIVAGDCTPSTDQSTFTWKPKNANSQPYLHLDTSWSGGPLQRWPLAVNNKPLSAANNTVDTQYSYDLIYRPGIGAYGAIVPTDYSYEVDLSPYGYSNTFPPWFLYQGVVPTQQPALAGSFSVSFWYKYNRLLDCVWSNSKFDYINTQHSATSGIPMPGKFIDPTTGTTCLSNNNGQPPVPDPSAYLGNGYILYDTASNQWGVQVDVGFNMYDQVQLDPTGQSFPAPVPRFSTYSGAYPTNLTAVKGYVYNVITTYDAPTLVECIKVYEYDSNGYLTNRSTYAQPYSACKIRAAITTPISNIVAHYNDPTRNDLSDLVVFNGALSAPAIHQLYPRAYNVCTTATSCVGCQVVTPTYYTCTSCAHGETDPQCRNGTWVNPCRGTNGICNNNGVCVNNANNSYVCQCDSAHIGPNCDLPNPCATVNCHGQNPVWPPLIPLNGAIPYVNRYPLINSLLPLSAMTGTYDNTYSYKWSSRYGLGIYGAIVPGDFGYSWFSNQYDNNQPWPHSQGVQLTHGLSLGTNATVSIWFEFQRATDCPVTRLWTGVNPPANCTVSSCDIYYWTPFTNSFNCSTSNMFQLIIRGQYLRDTNGRLQFWADSHVDNTVYNTGTSFPAYVQPHLYNGGGINNGGANADNVGQWPRMLGMVYGYVYNTIATYTPNSDCFYIYEYNNDGYLTNRTGWTQPFSMCYQSEVSTTPIGDLSIHYGDPSHNPLSDLVIYDHALSGVQVDQLYRRAYNECTDASVDCGGCYQYTLGNGGFAHNCTACLRRATGDVCQNHYNDPCGSTGDITVCNGHGSCSSPTNNTFVCACDPSRNGTNCEIPICNPVDPHVDPTTCTCTAPYFSSAYGRGSQLGVFGSACNRQCVGGTMVFASGFYSCVAGPTTTPPPTTTSLVTTPPPTTVAPTPTPTPTNSTNTTVIDTGSSTASSILGMSVTTFAAVTAGTGVAVVGGSVAIYFYIIKYAGYMKVGT